jgi:hypothetical protein
MSVAHDHRPGAEQVINVLIAADIPDVGTAPLFDDERVVVREADVSKRATGKNGCGSG